MFDKTEQAQHNTEFSGFVSGTDLSGTASASDGADGKSSASSFLPSKLFEINQQNLQSQIGGTTPPLYLYWSFGMANSFD